MARDRQRAKQRRRRQPGAPGPVSGSSRARSRDAAGKPADAEHDATPASAPEPTEHELPEIEDEPIDGASVPVAPAADALDPAVTEEREYARPGRRKRGKILTFLGHVIDELRRVQWPDRRHVGQGTAVVLGFVVIAGSYLGLMDAIFKPLIEAIL